MVAHQSYTFPLSRKGAAIFCMSCLFVEDIIDLVK